MATVRLSDLIQPFSGEGDVVQWLDKLALVSKRLKDTPADVLPLFLEGPAYAVYSEMPEEDKESADAIATALKEAFGLNGFLAYEQLSCRRWRTGEPVDVYLAELRRLAKLADVESENLLRRAFIVGLPPDVSRELRAMVKVATTDLPTIVVRARALMAETTVLESAAASATMKPGRRRGVVGGAGGGAKNRGERGRCFRCGGQHLLRHCTATMDGQTLLCWTCGSQGHMARDCHQGNASGRAGAPVALPNMQ